MEAKKLETELPYDPAILLLGICPEKSLIRKDNAPMFTADLFMIAKTLWRRKWQPTPVFLPGESQGQRSLEGCRLWGSTESNTTEAT